MLFKCLRQSSLNVIDVGVYSLERDSQPSSACQRALLGQLEHSDF